MKGGPCTALNPYFKSNISDEVFNIISKELDINGNVCEVLKKYFEYTNKHRKLIDNHYDLQFNDYQDNYGEKCNQTY